MSHSEERCAQLILHSYPQCVHGPLMCTHMSGHFSALIIRVKQRHIGATFLKKYCIFAPAPFAFSLQVAERHSFDDHKHSFVLMT